MAATNENENENKPSESQPAESRRGSTNRSSSDATKRTPGTPAGAKVAKATEDKPLDFGNVGPRDALIVDGHNEGDYVPDVEGKGYHVGLVRQPVMALMDEHGRIVGYEAAKGESKFERGSLENLKRAHNERERGWKEGRDFRTVSPEPSVPGASR